MRWQCVGDGANERHGNSSDAKKIEQDYKTQVSLRDLGFSIYRITL